MRSYGFNDLITLNRASARTRFNHYGVLTEVPAGQPAMDHYPETLAYSSSSVTLGQGVKVFAVDKLFEVGARVRATADDTHYLNGVVTGSVPGSVTLQVEGAVVGSGTFASWTLIVERGLAVEGERTNLLGFSSDISQWNRGGSTPLVKEQKVAIAPNGDAEATRLTFTADYQYVLGTLNTAAAGQAYCASVYAKRNSGKFTLRISNTTSSRVIRAVVDTDSQTITATGSTGASENLGVLKIEASGDWDRYAVVGRYAEAVANVSIMLVRENSTQLGAIVWGAQLELGSTPSSYIHTPATFTGRASTATYNDANGALQTAAAGVARDNHHVYIDGQWVKAGLLLEGQATNLIPNSQMIGGGVGTVPSSWAHTGAVGSSVVANVVNTEIQGFACRAVQYRRVNGTTGYEGVQSYLTIAAGAVVTVTVYVRIPTGVTPTELILYGISGGPQLIATTAELSALPKDTWVKYTKTYTNGGSTQNHISFASPKAEGAGTGFDIAMPQVEAGSVATSYIPTTTAQATRAADTSTSSAVTRLADDPTLSSAFSWHRPDEGQWEIDIDVAAEGTELLSYGDTFLASLVSGKGKVVIKYQNGTGSLFANGAKLYEFSSYHGFDPVQAVNKLAAGGSAAIQRISYLPKSSDDATAASKAVGAVIAKDRKVGSMVPSLELDYVNDKYARGLKYVPFEDLHTMTRASSAWCYGPDKVYREVAANLPRLDHDPVTGAPLGILVEESRTNLRSRSNDLENSVYSKTEAAVLPFSTVAPDGSLTARRLVVTSANNSHGFSMVAAISGAGTYTWSVFVKAAGLSKVLLGQDTGQGGNATFDLQTKTATKETPGETNVPAIVDCGNGWFRCCNTFTATAATSLYCRMLDAAGNVIYQGDGVSGLHFWGVQLEQGSFPTSYIPTPAVFQSRSSTATYLDSNGVLQTAAANVARDQAYGYDEAGVLRKIGLLVEGQATNLITNSEMTGAGVGVMPTGWAAIGAVNGISVAVVGAGTEDGHKYIDVRINGTATATTYSGITIPGTGSAVEGDTFTCSANIRLIAGSFSGFSGQTTDTTEGLRLVQVGASGWYGLGLAKAGVSDAPLSKQRYSKTATLSGAGLTGCSVSIQMPVPSGTSVDITLRISSPQLEKLPARTSYIPTTTAQVTRAADVTTSSQATRAADTVSVDNLAPWYRSDEGTLFVEASHFGTPVAGQAFTPVALTKTKTDITDRVLAGQILNSAYRAGGVGVANTDTALISSSGPLSFNAPFKAAIGIALNNVNGAKDGVLGIADTTSGLPTVGAMTIGSLGQAQRMNGHIRSIRFFPKRLPDAELQSLTTP